MRRIGERIDQTHRDRFDPLGEQRVDGAFGVGTLQRAIDTTVGIDAFIDDLTQVALDQRRRLHPTEVVEPRHAQRANLEDVAKALGGDQSDARALVLEDRIRCDRGAVADLFDCLAIEPRLGEQLGQPVDDRARVVVDAGRDLLRMDRTVGAEQHDVGKRSADVDADRVASHGRASHSHHSAARGYGSGSCHCTFGTSRQPRATRISARHFVVAVASTVQRFVSTITP